MLADYQTHGALASFHLACGGTVSTTNFRRGMVMEFIPILPANRGGAISSTTQRAHRLTFQDHVHVHRFLKQRESPLLLGCGLPRIILRSRYANGGNIASTNLAGNTCTVRASGFTTQDIGWIQQGLIAQPPDVPSVQPRCFTRCCMEQ